MLKRDELQDPNSCLNKALIDERIFILLARDLAAASTIRFWVNERIRLGKNSAGDAQIQEALACAEAIEYERVMAQAEAENQKQSAKTLRNLTE